MWGIIGTWSMSKVGVQAGSCELVEGCSALDAAEICVKDVEANPAFTSVGLGGLPNEDGIVEVDGAVMDGDTLSIGVVMGIKDYLHPSSIARTLLKLNINNVLVGSGAEKYANDLGFEKCSLLTEGSQKKWRALQQQVQKGLSPYIGHDTVCAIALDQNESMATVTSTSGLFYKKPGRVGDSPIPGSGFYVDSEIGGACATGLGEDIMKGSLSFEIVRLMNTGLSPQQSCEQAVNYLNHLLIKKRGKSGDLSVIAMNALGDYGAATNIDEFPFVVMTAKMGLIEGIASYKEGIHSQVIL